MERESEWKAPPVCGGLPIEDNIVLEQIKHNLLRTKLPTILRVERHDYTMLFAAGGLSLQASLDELRERVKDPTVRLFTSNKTHDYLIENGIVPWAQIIVDPKESMIDYCKAPHSDVNYLIGLQCNPGVFEALQGYKVAQMFVPCGIGENDEDKDTNLVRESGRKLEPVFGGTMAPLRAMCLAEVLGFRKMEFYGFDSSVQVGKCCYAYEKERYEDVLEVECPDGKTFLSTPVFASQAREYLKWKDRLSGCVEFDVHGDGLIAHLHKLDEAEKMEGKSTLISKEYVALNAQLHNDNELYGTSGHLYAGHVAKLRNTVVEKFQAATVLDYGCGKQTLRKAVNFPVTGYDPAIKGLDESPDPHDIVVCTDVLEHIEPDCLKAVVLDLKRVTKKLLYLAIHLGPAKKFLADGRNAHLIQKDPPWWYYQLRPHFRVLEHREVGNSLLVVCQARDIV